MQLPFDFEKAIDGISKVTLRGGVVGKVTFAVVLVSLALAAISWSVPNIWLAGAALVMVFVLAMTAIWRLINFADRHPQAALLEGAEFLVHEQIVHASKNNPIIQVDAIEKVQPEIIEGPAANPELAKVPDEETLEIAKGGAA